MAHNDDFEKEPLSKRGATNPTLGSSRPIVAGGRTGSIGPLTVALDCAPMRLYVCWDTAATYPLIGAHPCGVAYHALRDAGHDPEVKRAYGWAKLPDFINFNLRSPRGPRADRKRRGARSSSSTTARSSPAASRSSSGPRRTRPAARAEPDRSGAAVAGRRARDLRRRADRRSPPRWRSAPGSWPRPGGGPGRGRRPPSASRRRP